MTDYQKPPMDKLDEWVDVSADCPGRLIVKRFPAEQMTEGGLHIPAVAQERPDHFAWVVRASHPRFKEGDSVMAPAYAFSGGVALPESFGDSLVIVEARDMLMVWRPKE